MVKCPNCGSIHTFRHDYEIWGDTLYLYYYCCNCNKYFTEVMFRKDGESLYDETVKKLLQP